MIVIDIKLVSARGREHDRMLGRVKLGNDGTGTKTRGNYTAVFFSRAKRRFKTKRILFYPRKAKSIWALLKEVFA